MVLKKSNTALISINGISDINILIPKIRGKGYVKSPFGGHHSNDKYKELSRFNIDMDVSDIDGYVNIHTSYRINQWDDAFNDYVNNIKKVFEELFPRIKSWKEIELRQFMDIVIKGEK
jgi:hypothetical protein